MTQPLFYQRGRRSAGAIALRETAAVEASVHIKYPVQSARDLFVEDGSE
jgi:hypothetical protein